MFRIGICTERVWTELDELYGNLGGRLDRAQLRSAEVSCREIGGYPYAHLAARRRRRAELQTTDQAEMDVQHPIAIKLTEQVLAVSGRLDHAGLVQQRRRLSEPALGAAHRNHSAGKCLCQIESQPVQRMTFRQITPLAAWAIGPA